MTKSLLKLEEARQRWSVRKLLQGQAGGHATPLEVAAGLAKYSLEQGERAQDRTQWYTTASIFIAYFGAWMVILELLPDEFVPEPVLAVAPWIALVFAVISIFGAASAADNASYARRWKAHHEQDQQDVEAIVRQLRSAQNHDFPAGALQQYRDQSKPDSSSTASPKDVRETELFPETEGNAESGSRLRQLLHVAALACEGNELLPNEAEWREQTAWFRHVRHTAQDRVDFRDIPQQSLADMARTAQIIIDQARVESVDEARVAWRVFTHQNQHTLLQHVTQKQSARKQTSQVTQP